MPGVLWGKDIGVTVAGLADLMQERNLKGISAGDVLRLGELYNSYLLPT